MEPSANSLENIFLIYCSRIAINDEIKERLKTLASSGLDWLSLIYKARRQGVAQFLYFHLSRLQEIWSVIPEELKNKLKQSYQSILIRNWSTQIELQKVVSLLNHAQIQVIVLKGASLLGTVYKNIGLRPMVDVDLLVERKDFSKIKSILHQAGYQKADNLDQESLEKFGGEIRLCKKGRLSLDIHSNLSQYERFGNIFRIDMDGEIWNKSKTYKAPVGELRILNPSHLIMHLCMHQAIAHYFAGLFRFCDLRETVLTYQQDIDWHDLILKVERYKIKKIVYYSLFFTQELFGRIVSDDVLEALRPNKKQRILTDFFVSKKKILSLPNREPTFKKYIGQLFLMDNFLDIPRVVIKSLFPSDEWLMYKYHVRKKLKLIFYRLFHPIITLLNILS
ncbi:MAG: nucleotidyltransferase family protein [Candidatus Omnitrophica bacterium]|nr:nucleotidyltransferase family protein [Candidatus Omnitrophota bacterium]